jgi:hypothetical protein
VAAVAIVLVPGAFLTPLITNAFLTAERLAPPGTVTEAYAWLVSAVGTGQAAGTALAGRTAEDHALATAALPALGSFAALTLLIAARRHLSPPDPRPRGEPLAVRTTWTVDHACGHRIDHDLSARRVDERAGYARWLETRSCTDCWRAAHTADAAATREWIAARRAEEEKAASEWAGQYDMPPLAGSEKAVAWGNRCRYQLVTAAYSALVAEGDTGEQQWAEIEEAARALDRAGWWIDQVRHEAPRNRVEVEGLHRRLVAARR